VKRDDPSTTHRVPWRFRLSARLAIAVCVLLLALGVVLTTFVVPRTAAAFASHSAALLREGSETMHDFARQQIVASRTVLVDLIRHTATARLRALQDLPFDLDGSDSGAIREAIEGADAQRSERQQRNVEVLATEMQRRASSHIDQRLHALATAQEERTAAFAASLRETHLTLVAIAFLLMLLVLGGGLHFLVVRPTLQLRRATQRVAGGDLTIDLPPATNDELGDLARDFEQMVLQLRASRTALRQLASGLEVEVQKQTGHLQRTLAELRDSHQHLAQAERLAALGTLAGGIAHEFHNLIGGIRGCSDELLAEEAQPDRRETLTVIVRATDRATGIVRQLLRFARHSVDADGELDPATIVEDALRLCEPAARRQGVRVARSLAPGLRVHGDADALHQVAVNLLTNALQAMPDGGALQATVAQNGKDVCITIADNGVGIAAEDLPHVFEPFFTTRGAERDPKRRGSGLGLSVSYGIVTAHGGRITVTSSPGEGAAFAVVLPAGPREPG
jgi:signal transduction histidine kinase